MPKHNRKYIVAPGRAVYPAAGDQVDLDEMGFWGEWEPPSRYERLHGSEAHHPSTVHSPVLPREEPKEARQNTDPLVFGNHFVYSNCQQGKRVMRTLAPGSIIMFGRGMKVHGEYGFALDTCMVVDGPEKIVLSPAAVEPYGSDLLSDAVLGALLSDVGEGRAAFVYRGRTPRQDDPLGEPFSFVPAVRAAERPEGFARPLIEPVGKLQDRITPTHKQGVKTSPLSDPEHACEVWKEIVDQVRGQGLLLGTLVAAPPWEAL
jgi:hypothetical protein